MGGVVWILRFYTSELFLTTISVGILIVWNCSIFCDFLSIESSSNSAAVCPISKAGCTIVLNEGASKWATFRFVNPINESCSGIRIPCSFTAEKQSKASLSLVVKMASGFWFSIKSLTSFLASSDPKPQYFTKDSQVFYATATLLKSLFYLKNNQLDLAKQYAIETLKLPRASAIIKEQAKAIIAGISIKA